MVRPKPQWAQCSSAHAMAYSIGRNIALLVWRINRAEFFLNLELVHRYNTDVQNIRKSRQQNIAK